MTPEQRAKEVYERHEGSYNHCGVLEGSYDLDLEELVTAAIKSAIAEERERCAIIVERHAIPGHTVQLPTIMAAVKAIRGGNDENDG